MAVMVAVARIVAVAVLAGSMMTMAGAARADATRPSVVRPDIARVGDGSGLPGDCELIPVRAGSDDGLFGTAGSDGIR